MSPRIRFSLRFATAALLLSLSYALLFFKAGGPILTLTIAGATFTGAYLIAPISRASGWLHPRLRGGIVGLVIGVIGHFGGFVLLGIALNVATILEGQAPSFSVMCANVLWLMFSFIFARLDLFIWLPLGYYRGRRWLPQLAAEE